MEYFRPRSIEDAYAILDKYGTNAVPIAGSSFFMGHREELFDEVEAVVDIKRVGLAYIRASGDALHLGATTTLAEILASDVLRTGPWAVLQETVARLNIKEVRNVATVGGEVCIAGEVDLPTTLLALDALIVLGSARGERALALGEFHRGYLNNALERGEIVTEVRIPRLPVRTGAAFSKFERTFADLPLVNVAVRMSLAPGGEVSDARVSVGAAVAVPVRSRAAEQALTGRKPTAAVITAAAAATADIECVGDIRASAELRALWVRCGAEDALHAAVRNAEG